MKVRKIAVHRRKKEVGIRNIKGKIGLVVVMVLVVGLLSLATVPVSAELEGWQYHKGITIREKSGQTLVDYQVLVDLSGSNFPVDAKPDGSDLRFLLYGEELCYWVEEFNPAAKTGKVWVKVPKIPANGATTIRMYYGNPKAYSQSNGDATFEFFDDFEGGTLNKWSIISGSWDASDGILRCVNYPYRDWVYLLSNYGHHTNVIFESEIRVDEKDIGGHGIYGVLFAFKEELAFRRAYCDQIAGDVVVEKKLGFAGHYPGYCYNHFGPDFVSQTGRWYHYKLIYKGDEKEISIYDENNNLLASYTSTYPNMFDATDSGIATLLTKISVDNYRLRKYTSSEPTVTFSTEYATTYTQTPTPTTSIGLDISHGVDEKIAMYNAKEEIFKIVGQYGAIKEIESWRSTDLENYDLIIIYSPKMEYTEEELKKIIGYVESGGSLLIMGPENAHMSKFAASKSILNQISSKFGIHYSERGYGAFQDPKTMYFNHHPITEGLKEPITPEEYDGWILDVFPPAEPVLFGDQQRTNCLLAVYDKTGKVVVYGDNSFYYGIPLFEPTIKWLIVDSVLPVATPKPMPTPPPKPMPMPRYAPPLEELPYGLYYTSIEIMAHSELEETQKKLELEKKPVYGEHAYLNKGDLVIMELSNLADAVRVYKSTANTVSEKYYISERDIFRDKSVSGSRGSDDYWAVFINGRFVVVIEGIDDFNLLTALAKITDENLNRIAPIAPPIAKPIPPPSPIASILPIVAVALIAIILIAGIRRSRKGKKDKLTKPKPSAELPNPTTEAVKPEPVSEPAPTKPDSGINVTSAFGYKGAVIVHKIKVENPTSEPVSDIKIHLFVPEVFMLKEQAKNISLLKPEESKTVTFEVRPTGECGDCDVSGRVTYYDYASNTTKEVNIPSKTLSIVCPLLKIKEIDEDAWRVSVSGLVKAAENTKEIDMPAKTLFEVISDILKDMNMFMLPLIVTDTPQLYRATARFYAEGVKELKYAAQIEVLGGAKKAKLIMKAWAEKEEALTGFYHGMLDEIEKRVQVKDYIDDSIVQQFYHIGDRIGAVVKDSVVQRSAIGSDSGNKCPSCGKEVSEDERFCPECGVELK